MDFVTLLRMDVKNRLNDLVGEEGRILLLGVETNVFDIASRFTRYDREDVLKLGT